MNDTTSPLLLKLPTWLYGTAMTGRNLAYDLLPGLSKAVDIPIVCIGNITTGGTGKTPMTAFLTRHFQAQGLRVAILSRGYGRREKQTQKIINSQSNKNNLTTAKIGDEALMLHHQLDNITIVLDGNRVRGAQTIQENRLADIIIMDDGFQHRHLRRDFNIVMIDSQRLFGNRQQLPAGPLRESIRGLKRADAVIFNKFDQRHPDFYSQAAETLSHIAAKRLFCASYHYQKFTNLCNDQTKSLDELKRSGPLCAVSGLANNNYFFDQLKTSGLDIAASFPFRDHYTYTRSDLDKIKDICQERPLLTTAKDADKLRQQVPQSDKNFSAFRQNIWIAEIELKIDKETDFLELFKKIS